MTSSLKKYLSSTAIFITLGLYSAESGYSQIGWERLLGGSNSQVSPSCIEIVDSQTVFVAGWTGNVFYSTDKGVTWNNSLTGASNTLTGISFFDRKQGTVVGSSGIILATTDGGISWQQQTNGVPNEYFTDVEFSDSLKGVVIGSNNTILHTTDGGEMWLSSTYTNLSSTLQSVSLIKEQGLVVGRQGRIFLSSDAGFSWFSQTSGTTQDLWDAYLLDSLIGFVVGSQGTLLHTSNGGTTWTPISLNTTEKLQTVYFIDSLNGIIGGISGAMFSTSNGGETWTQGINPGFSSIHDVSFHNGSFGMILDGSSARVYRTTDAGSNWQEMEYSWYGTYTGVSATDENTITAVGTSGKIIRSTNGGNFWISQLSNVTTNLHGIDFIDSVHGIAVGDAGIILRTTNGGNNWLTTASGLMNALNAVSMPTQNTAIVVGANGLVLRTPNGGETWAPQESGLNENLRGVSFLDKDYGVAIGENGSIIMTDNGGINWNIVYSSSGIQLFSVQYINEDNIIAVGNNITSDYPQMKLTLKSFDGGITWKSSFVGENISPRLLTVSFTDENVGFAAGWNGMIYLTQDGGNNWKPLFATNTLLTGPTFFSISFPTPRAAFAVGEYGTIMRLICESSLEGTVYNDIDNNGTRSAGEMFMGGWKVRLSGRVNDSTTTDINGSFSFNQLPVGMYGVASAPTLYWEQTDPLSFDGSLFDGHSVTISSSGQHVSGKAVGVHGPVTKVKIPMNSCDDTSNAFGSTYGNRNIYWGVRPGATFGIFNTSPQSSYIDSLEHEAEVPPRSFAEFIGLFDVRFMDPRYSITDIGYDFGMGAFTDMRDFSSPSQIDSHLISLLAGYIYGGKYPITLRWYNDLVSLSYSGPVTLQDPNGVTVDMKTENKMVINDSTIHSLRLIAHYPNIPAGYALKWNLVSLPAFLSDRSAHTLFPSASTPPYSFDPAIGYRQEDSLLPGNGYWLKYRNAADTLSFDKNERLSDTITVSEGWNLIGTLSSSVDVNSIETEPAGLYVSSFYGYDGGYHIADSLSPGKAYWVKTEQNGALLLNASVSNMKSKNKRMVVADELKQSSRLTFRDAVGNTGTIYFSRDKGIDSRFWKLPPLPPKGAFDVRFTSHHLLEIINEGHSQEFPILIQSPAYPLTIEWDATSLSVSAVLNIGGRETPLSGTGSAQLTSMDEFSSSTGSSSMQISLLIYSGTETPKEYALQQNYPNPFNPSTIIKYSLPQEGGVRLEIYNMLGQKVKTIVDEYQQAGYKSVRFDAYDFSAGVYFYRLTAGTFTETKKLLLLK